MYVSQIHLCVNVFVSSGTATSLVNIQDISADKYDESLHKLIASSTPVLSDKAAECFLNQSMGFEIPSAKKYVTDFLCQVLMCSNCVK